MYTQFSFAERSKFHEALKTLNSEANGEKYQEALSSALQVLNNSQAYPECKFAWAAEIISAYREVGKSLVKRINKEQLLHDKILEDNELMLLEKEFSETLSEYGGETIIQKMGTILRDLEKIVPEELPEYSEQTLTGRVRSALVDFANISRVMNRYDLRDGDDLETALRQKQELLKQAETFEASI